MLEKVLLFLFILFFFSILPSMFCFKRAGILKRNTTMWGILGFIFSYITVIVTYFLLEPRKQT